MGVTGTNGKTTTTYLVRSILEANATACGVIGTTGYVLDDVKLTPHGGVWEPEEDDPTQERECTAPGWLAPYKGKYEVPNTTPDALQCQQLMAGMLDNGASAVAMEVSSHALAQGRVDCVDYDVAVFTNLTRDHLDFHGSMEAYREAKAELFRRLEDPERQRAVINLDVPPKPKRKKGEAEEEEEEEDGFDNAAYFKAAAGGGDRVPIITYATDSKMADEADVFVEQVDLTLFETSLTVRTPAGTFDAVCGIIGEVNVTNIAAAVAVGVALGVPLDVIAQGVEAMEPVPGRMELVDEGQPFPVVVDYAHTPDALRRAIESARKMGAANVITVFGCGGDRDPKKRAEMGKVADTHSDIVFVTNDNPRTEDPYKILDDVVAGFRDRVYNLDNIKQEAMFPFLKDMYLIHPNARHETMKLQNMCRRYVIVDRWYAIRGAIAMAGEDDVVLICGKGREDYAVRPGTTSTGSTTGWRRRTRCRGSSRCRRLAWTRPTSRGRGRIAARRTPGTVTSSTREARGERASGCEGGTPRRRRGATDRPRVQSDHFSCTSASVARARVVVSRIFSHASSPSSMVAWTSAATRRTCSRVKRRCREAFSRREVSARVRFAASSRTPMVSASASASATRVSCVMAVRSSAKAS